MWKVAIIERESGWGPRVDEIKEFATLDQALSFQTEFNRPNQENYVKTKRVPDWYMQAEDPYEA